MNLFAAFEPSTLVPAPNATVSAGSTFSDDRGTRNPPAARKFPNLFGTFTETRMAIESDENICQVASTQASADSTSQTSREPRSREYMESRECNAENVHLLLQTDCGCGKNCMHRIRGKLDDPFTAVHEVRIERFSMRQKDEKHWWFNKLLACKQENLSGKMSLCFKYHGILICRFAFYEIHGFRGDRKRVSSRSKAFEQMICTAGYTHVPDDIRSKPQAVKSSVASRWIWRHIKVNGLPKPNATGTSGTVVLTQKDVSERYQMYVSDLTCDGTRSLDTVYGLKVDAFRKLWNKEWNLGWTDEYQHHFDLKTWRLADRSGMRVCRICSTCFEQLVKAKSTDERELLMKKR